MVIDTLTLTVSSEPQAAQVTLEALGRIHDMGGHTILGVSNVSFGLPAREKINSAFLTLALSAGLDCAIMNPLSAAMMSAWRAFAVLTARDARCEDYIAHESNAEPPKPAAASGISLGGCIEKGLTDAGLCRGKAPRRRGGRAARGHKQRAHPGARPRGQGLRRRARSISRSC